jgi:monomeric sarcosine oxidase
MAKSVDVLVIGAGLMGAAAAWSLVRREHSVALVEQYDSRHVHGSSHGSARIMRRAYGDALYTRLAGQAFELWREIEHSSGETLLHLYGGLDFGAERGVRDIARNLAEAGVERELLSADEAEARWPGMRFEDEVVFHPQAGTLDAALAVDAMLGLASASGADVRFSRAVTAIAPSESAATVTFDDGTSVTAGVVVVAAGGWVGGLLAGLVELPPMRVSEQSVFHFPRSDPSAVPWPSVIHEARGHATYHLAGGRDGGTGNDRKIGRHDFGPAVSPARAITIDEAVRAELTEYVTEWLPGLEPTPRGETTCLYTVTPSEDFVLDRVGPIVVCSPCSGHGAKFAPLIGELVADLVAGDADVPDRFRLSAHATGRLGSVSL